LAIGDWRLATRDRRLAISNWEPAIGNWQLGTGDWRPVARHVTIVMCSTLPAPVLNKYGFLFVSKNQFDMG
jgi:hypothetical protein